MSDFEDQQASEESPPPPASSRGRWAKRFGLSAASAAVGAGLTFEAMHKKAPPLPSVPQSSIVQSPATKPSEGISPDFDVKAFTDRELDKGHIIITGSFLPNDKPCTSEDLESPEALALRNNIKLDGSPNQVIGTLRFTFKDMFTPVREYNIPILASSFHASVRLFESLETGDAIEHFHDEKGFITSVHPTLDLLLTEEVLRKFNLLNEEIKKHPPTTQKSEELILPPTTKPAMPKRHHNSEDDQTASLDHRAAALHEALQGIMTRRQVQI